MRKELLIGCGHNHDKRLCLHGHEKWEGLVTLDINQRLAPDICWDLTKLPYPIEADFRYMYSADFDVFAAEDDGEGVRFILSAVKPSRIAR